MAMTIKSYLFHDGFCTWNEFTIYSTESYPAIRFYACCFVDPFLEMVLPLRSGT
jgi:hypothetical protein